METEIGIPAPLVLMLVEQDSQRYYKCDLGTCYKALVNLHSEYYRYDFTWYIFVCNRNKY